MEKGWNAWQPDHPSDQIEKANKKDFFTKYA
jgi:hypothetical protein